MRIMKMAYRYDVITNFNVKNLNFVYGIPRQVLTVSSFSRFLCSSVVLGSFPRARVTKK
jgi:hypothetical protein